jgi:hypothetical protein
MQGKRSLFFDLFHGVFAKKSDATKFNAWVGSGERICLLRGESSDCEILENRHLLIAGLDEQLLECLQ